MKNKINLIVALFFILHCVAGNSVAQIIWDDDFSEGSINPYWNIYRSGSNTVVQNNGAVAFGVGTANFSRAYLMTDRTQTGLVEYEGSSVYDFFDHALLIEVSFPNQIFSSSPQLGTFDWFIMIGAGATEISPRSSATGAYLRVSRNLEGYRVSMGERGTSASPVVSYDLTNAPERLSVLYDKAGWRLILIGANFGDSTGGNQRSGSWTAISEEIFATSQPIFSMGTVNFSSVEPSYSSNVEGLKIQAFEYTKSVIDLMKQAADYQIAAYGGIPMRGWQRTVFMMGLLKLYEQSEDIQYLNFANSWGQNANWEVSQYHLHADGISSGQVFLKLYHMQGQKNQDMINDVRTKIDDYFEREIILREELVNPRWTEPEREFNGRNMWWWCDALFMAPPSLAWLGEITPDSKYFDLLDTLYFDTIDFLYDNDSQLFYRDSSYFYETGWPSRRESPTGEKVFWGRGNGWVMAGLIPILEILPDSRLTKTVYINLLEELAESVALYQQEDGLWRSSINEPTWYPAPETSGSAMILYSLASGVRNGWLNMDLYEPIIKKAWEGLVSHIQDSGAVGYSQKEAAGPGEVSESDVTDYGQGEFLLAASEILLSDWYSKTVSDLADEYSVGNQDGEIDYYDLLAIAQYWLAECSYPDWCIGVDINQSSRVNLKDFSILARSWTSSY